MTLTSIHQIGRC